jgi:murein DD-endopeptidase MepM/ murein hydrolase activator NlpD
MKKKKLITRLRHKYLITILNEQTFEKHFSIKLSKMHIISLLFSFSMLITVLVTMAIAFTSLKEFIPGYDTSLRKTIVENSIYLDSLSMELQKRDRFFASIQKVISGKDKPELEETIGIDTSATAHYTLDYIKTEEEYKFRSIIEEQERFNLHLETENIRNNSYQKYFRPIDGIISQKFNAKNNHFGIDIVAKQNSRISTVLNGTVIFAGWTVNTGYVISIQHRNNTISTYKHNAILLKKTGDHVKAGEAIAILGNTGELTTSTHLHFELWRNGKATDPELFIKFK